MKMKFLSTIFCLMGMSFFSFAQMTLTIEQALDIAEDNNPQMRTAKLNFERTLFSLVAERAGLKPQLSLTLDPFSYYQERRFDSYRSEWYTNKTLSTGGVFQTVLPILLTDGVLSLTNTFDWANRESQIWDNTTGKYEPRINKGFSNNLALRFDQPIFTFNRRQMTIKNLEFNHENSGISYALARLRTEQSITSQFYEVYLSKNNLEISQAELENAKKNYDIIKDKVDAELSAREELFQAEVNLANAESSVQLRDVTLRNTKDDLKKTLGLSLNEEIDVAVTIEVIPMLINEEKAIYSGLASRMELRQREIAIAKEDLAMIETKALNEFKGNVRLSVGIAGDDPNFGNIYSTPTNSPRVSISFNIPIFDWGQKKARIQAQKAAQVIAQYAYEDEKIDIELFIRRSLRSLENLRRQIDIQAITVRNAQLTYELNQIRYREGDLTGLQMNQYQTQLSNAKTSLVKAQIDYKKELLSLKILTLYDFENDRQIIPVKELQHISLR